MEITFAGEIIFWRGPAPWYFVAVPQAHSLAIKAIASAVTYGWGVIPVRVQIGGTAWETSLFPKDTLYLVPIKAAVRKAEHVDEGDRVTVHLEVKPRLRPDTF